MAVNSVKMTNTVDTSKLTADTTNKKTNTSANLFESTSNNTSGKTAVKNTSKSTVEDSKTTASDGQKVNNEANKLSDFETTQKQLAESEKKLFEMQEMMNAKALEQEALYAEISNQQGVLTRVIEQAEKKYNPIEHGENKDAYVQSQLSESPMYAAASKVLQDLNNKNQDIVGALGIIKLNFAAEQTIFTETNQKLMNLYNEINTMYSAGAEDSESYNMLM